uniref:Uncharacterized protein MANES_14G073700 n=1 Tax=Rhizophora mucronata TaxID=61149 RepID=A0A2P2Q9Z5_RHIMU
MPMPHSRLLLPIHSLTTQNNPSNH